MQHICNMAGRTTYGLINLEIATPLGSEMQLMLLARA